MLRPRSAVLGLMSLLLLAAPLSAPSASANHAGSSIGSQSACNLTACGSVTILIDADQCAYLQLGTPCTAYVRTYLSANSRSLLLFSSLAGSGTVTDQQGRSASCSYAALNSCSAQISQVAISTYRGAQICWSATALVRDTLSAVTVPLTHCYEAH